MTILRTTEPFNSFRVTYDCINEESCELGATCESGYLAANGIAVDEYYQSDWEFRDLTDRLTGYYVEGDGAKIPRWVTIYPESQFFIDSFWQSFCPSDAISATVSIHRPDWISDASWLRVLKVIGWRNKY